MKQKLCVLALVLAFTASCLVLCPLSEATQGKRNTPGSAVVDVPDPERDPGLYFLLAEQSEAQGDAEGVLHYFRKALQLDPTSAYLNTRIATLLARNRKLADALILSKNASLFDPNYDEAFTLIGKIYTITGDRTRAIEAYNRALELKPDDADLYIFIGSLQAAEKLYAEAEKTFHKMIQQFPDERDGYYYLGKVYLENKDYDRAVETFQSLLEKRPDSASAAHLELGEIYLRQKN
jgi:tetratricopeptide (TPR) repeat protein